MKIAFLSGWFPIPTDNGSKIRILNLLRGLSQYHQVTLFAFNRDQALRPDLSSLKDCCHEVFVVPWKHYNPRGLRARLGYFSPKPRSLVDTYSVKMEGIVRQQVGRRNSFDLVVLSQFDSLNYLPLFTGIPALLEELELGAIYDVGRGTKNPAAVIRRRLTWWKTTRYILRLLPDLRLITVVSDAERELLASFAPGYQRVLVLPNGIDLAQYPYQPLRPIPDQIIFSGSLRYSVNYQAVDYLISQVLPIVKLAVPTIKLIISGNQEGLVNLPGQDDASVIYTGYVEDIHRLVASSCVSLAALKTGGGTRLKILEAMALGTPVVATSKGAEGLGAEHGSQILLADSPIDFADCIVNLLRDPAVHRHISEQGRQLVESKFDWKKIMPVFLQAVENIGG